MITYFYRNRKVGFSIAKVSNNITSLIKDKEIFEVPSHRSKPISILRNLIYIRKHRNKDGINHIVGDIHYGTLALIGCKSILTIHDTSAFDNTRGRLKKIIIKYLWFIWPLKIATRVVCISKETKKSIMRFTNREDIEIIHNAISQDFKYTNRRFNTNAPNILLVGTSWNKNILRICQALTNIKCKVTIIGSLPLHIITYLQNNRINYSNKLNLTDEEIFKEYVNCDLLCFCSLYEGFGMPIIEANAVGRPVVTSNIEPLIEIANNSAIFVNPYDIDQIEHGISQIICDEPLRKKLINNGLQNIKRFNALNIINKYKSIYNQIK